MKLIVESIDRNAGRDYYGRKFDPLLARDSRRVHILMRDPEQNPKWRFFLAMPDFRLAISAEQHLLISIPGTGRIACAFDEETNAFAVRYAFPGGKFHAQPRFVTEKHNYTFQESAIISGWKGGHKRTFPLRFYTVPDVLADPRGHAIV